MTDGRNRRRFHEFTVEAGAGQSYPVLVGESLAQQVPTLLGERCRVALICSRPEQASSLKHALTDGGWQVTEVVVPDAEAAKTPAVLADCWRRLGEAGFTRSDAVVSVGGGAITDLAGFVAATWLRGIRCVHVPTTLLAMVDAAIGGKTGIDTDAGKNLVGAFWEPTAVVCDVAELRSLPGREYVSGMAEVVKCGFIADPAILDLVDRTDVAALRELGPTTVEFVSRAIAVKIAAVTGDLRERTTDAGVDAVGIGREALNYGHTFGHAVERFSDYSWRHGEAVGVGMMYVAELGLRAGWIDADLVDQHRELIGKIGLPTQLNDEREWRFDELLAAMRLDKKSRGTQLRFVVLAGPQRPRILAGPTDSTLQECFTAIRATSPGSQTTVAQGGKHA